MAKTINVPGIGPTSSGKVYGVLIGGTVVSGFLIYKKIQTNKKQQAAAAAATAQAANAYGYGTAANAYGYGQGGYYSMSPYGYGASGGFNATGYYGYGLTAPPGGVSPVANTTNAQWAQAAITQLTQDGYTNQAVAAALGAYDTGAPVTSDQQGIIQAAIGVEGYPPVAGANGYPPSINVQGTPGGGTGGGQSQPPPTGGGGGTTPPKPGRLAALPQLNGLSLQQAMADIQASGYTLGTVSYQYQNIDPSQYLTHTVYSYTVVPGSHTVNIGLN